MKFGIFSDIHSNYDAFLEVLKIYEKEKIDRFICAGDIIGYGAEPDECIEKLKELNVLCVMGNHEYALKNEKYIQYFNDAAYLSIKWHSKNMSDNSKNYITNIPFHLKESIFEICHGSAFEPEEFHYLFLPEDYIKNFKYFESKVLIIGHTHVPDVFYFDETKKTFGQITGSEFILEKDLKYIINVGSVGQPRDKDPRACFCIYDDSENVFKIKRIEYDIKKSAKKIIEANLPEVLAHRLEYGI